MSDYETPLAELARARIYIKQYKDEMSALLKSVTDSPSYTAAKHGADEMTALADKLENDIRAAAIEHYTQTGDKTPHPKVTVKIYKTFAISDPARVLAWVKQNLAAALIVDEKQVKAYATKIGPVDGTALIEEPKAQIASEL